MLTLQMSKNRKYLFISCHPSYARRIREALPMVDFSYERKCWITHAKYLPVIEDAFQGELFYKTPKWFMDGLDEEPVNEADLYDAPAELPEFQIAPFDYQVEGARFMIDRIRRLGFCLNSDGVGSGKSFQALMTIGYFLKRKDVQHVLIICKKTIKTQWKNEIRKFTSWDIPVLVTGDGPKKKRNAVYASARGSSSCILITNYHNYLNDYAEINGTPWDLVVLDEAHQVKSHSSKMNRLIGHTMRGKRCIFLTATPILSSPEDIFGIVSMASFTYFGSYKDFEEEHLVIEYGKYGRQIIGARNLDVLNDKVADFMIRRSEKQISVELPEVVEIPMRVEADQTQMKLQEHIQMQLQKVDAEIEAVMHEAGTKTEESRDRIEEINEQRKMYIAARQFVADDPRIIAELEDGYVSRPLKKLLPDKCVSSQKTDCTVEVVESIVSSGEKVIIFCYYSTPARLLKLEIEEKLGVNVCIYTGDESMEDREKTVETFRNSADHPVLIGTDSMAEGLNLQVARYQIHYEQAQTAAMRTQRIGRSRRVGAKYSQICVYNMITEGSFDDDRINKIARDKEITQAVLG